MDLHVWLYTEKVIYSKFHRNPFRGFGAMGGQNLAFSITFAIGFYNSCLSYRIQGVMHQYTCLNPLRQFPESANYADAQTSVTYFRAKLHNGIESRKQ